MIHPSAIIEKGATIGENVSVGPFAFISKDAVIGDGCTIKQGACIYHRTILGEGCEVGSYSVLGEMPQSIGHDESVPVELIIGKNNRIKEYVLISLGTSSDIQKTVIGDDNYIMAYCHIGHDCVIGDGNIMANGTSFGGHCKVGNKNVFGAMAGMHQFIQIGSYCMIGGMSAVTQDIPPYVLVEGNRAVVKGLNSIGIRRNLDRETGAALKQAYRVLFRSNAPIKQSAQALLDKTQSDAVKALSEFILGSKRGIAFERVKEK